MPAPLQLTVNSAVLEMQQALRRSSGQLPGPAHLPCVPPLASPPPRPAPSCSAAHPAPAPAGSTGVGVSVCLQTLPMAMRRPGVILGCELNVNDRGADGEWQLRFFRVL